MTRSLTGALADQQRCETEEARNWFWMNEGVIFFLFFPMRSHLLKSHVGGATLFCTKRIFSVIVLMVPNPYKHKITFEPHLLRLILGKEKRMAV